MKHIFIINPTAGKSDSRQRIYDMADALRTRHDLDVQCILTKRQGHATELARKMVTQYGMSDKLGLMALSTVSNPYLDGSTMMNCADSTSSAADEEIHKLLMACYEDAKRLLTEHRALLDEIAMYLLTKETITGDEFMTYVNAENKKLTDGSEPAQDEQDVEAPASPDAPQEDAPSASD